MPMNTTFVTARRLPRERHLGDDLGAAELALEAADAGHAEHAADGAAHLARHAQAAARQQHRFDRAAVGQRDDEAPRAVGAGVVGAQHGERMQLGFERGQRRTHRERKEVFGTTPALRQRLGARPLTQHALFMHLQCAEGAQATTQDFEMHGVWGGSAAAAWPRERLPILAPARASDTREWAHPVAARAAGGVAMRWPVLLSMLLAACAAAPTNRLSRPEVPAPATVAVSETRFGIESADPYRWMEEPAREAEMVAWVRAMSAASTAQLQALPDRAAFAGLLAESTRAGTRYSDVSSSAGRLFYRRLTPADRVPSLVVREGSSERVLVDPTAGTAEVAAISNYTISPDGAVVAVHIAKGGGEVGEIRFIDVASGKQRGSPLGPIWGEFAVSWIAPDLVSYTRITASGPGSDLMQNMQSWLVKPGDPGPGRVVLGRNVAGSPDFVAQEFPILLRTPTSALALAMGTGARADLRLLVARSADVAAGASGWRELARYEDEVSNFAALDDDLYYLTTLGAPNGQVLRRRLAGNELTAPVTVLAEGGLVLSSLEATRDGVYVSGQRDGVGQLLFLPEGRGPAQAVALPMEGDLSNLRVDNDGRSVVFGLNGWTRATTYYRATAGRVEPLGLQSDSWSRAAELTTVREEAISADGTRVPMVVILPPGGKRAAMPTLLQGYGSYGALMVSPWYSPYLLPWAVNGGALAYCGTRGGGERGRAWHEGGRADKKPNAQADFIACAERLIETGYATPKTLAASGTSAGGLVVPPAVLKRPELFAAMVPRVAFLNATRLGAAPNGANQFAEMGDPDTEAGYRGLASQDAYLMLADAKDMPDTLITVGLNDKRVAPWFAAKFAARASQRFGGRRLVLVRADAEAGHGVGSARDSQIAEFADTLAFLRDRTAR